MFIQESTGSELSWFFKDIGVEVDAVQIGEDVGALRDVEPSKRRVLEGRVSSCCWN